MVVVCAEIDSDNFRGQGSTPGRGRTLSEDSDVSRYGCRISTVKAEKRCFVRHKGRPTCLPAEIHNLISGKYIMYQIYFFVFRFATCSGTLCLPRRVLIHLDIINVFLKVRQGTYV